MRPYPRARAARSAPLCLLATLAGCPVEHSLLPAEADTIEITPAIIHPDAAPGGCAEQALTLRGHDALLGLAWWPERGPADAVILPAIERWMIEGEAALTFHLCPGDDPSAGQILLSFEDAGLLGVWLEE